MKFNILFILSFLAISSSVQSQQSLTLQQCIDMAWERNLDLKSKEYSYQSSEIDLKQAKQARMPNLNGNSRVGLNLGKTIDPTSNQFINTSFLSNTFGLSSNISIYNYNRITNIIKQAKYSKASNKKDYEQLKMEVALQVTTSYVNTLFAFENVKNAELQLEQSQAQLKQMEILINTGTRPENDRLDLEAAVSLQEQNLINMENQYDLSKLGLKQLLRLDFKDEIDIELLTVYTLSANVETLTIERLVESVVEAYPALQSAVLNTKVAEMQMKIAKSSLYPHVTAGVSLGTNYSNQGKRLFGSDIILQERPVFIDGQKATLGTIVETVEVEDNPYFNQLNENVSYGFGVNVSIPIYNNYSNKASIEKAKLSYLQAENNEERVKNQLVLSLQQVLADAKASKKEMTASEKSLSSLNSAFDNAQKKNKQGVISTFEFIQVKNQMESAQLKNTIAKYNYIFKVKLLDYYLGL